MAHTKKFLAQGFSTIVDEETGREYPIPAGGDGTGEEKEEEEETPPSSEEQEEEEDEDEDEVGNFNGETFLNSIEEEELRQRLEPHVKRWDAGVTRRFQELHSQLKPYQELGDPEQLSEAAQLYEILNERPEDLYEALARSLGQQNVQQGQPGPQGQNQQNLNQRQQQVAQEQGLTQQQYSQLPPEVKSQLEQHGQILTTLAEHYLSEEKAKAQAQEDKELDDYLSNLEAEFGKFDEDYVLSKMAAGVDGAKAVKQYQKAVRNNSAQENNTNAPKILSGGGQVPQDSVNVGQADSKEIKNLVAGLISQARDQ